MQLTKQVSNIFAILNQSNPKCTKKGIINYLFNFLFGNSNSAEEIKVIKNNMAILKENQYILNRQTEKTFNFVNLTYVETDTNSLLKSPQKDIFQINSTVHCLSKELKLPFHDRNFFCYHVPVEKSFSATICNGINLVKIDILSILDQVSIISSHQLRPVSLSPLDLK